MVGFAAQHLTHIRTTGTTVFYRLKHGNREFTSWRALTVYNTSTLSRDIRTTYIYLKYTNAPYILRQSGTYRTWYSGTTRYVRDGGPLLLPSDTTSRKENETTSHVSARKKKGGLSHCEPKIVGCITASLIYLAEPLLVPQPTPQAHCRYSDVALLLSFRPVQNAGNSTKKA